MKKSKKFKNLTPHNIEVLSENGEVLLSIKPSGLIVRLEEKISNSKRITVNDQEVLIIEKEYGSCSLPEPKKNTIYIVSLPVAQTFPERQDFVIPDDLVRDDKGKIKGCTRFARPLTASKGDKN